MHFLIVPPVPSIPRGPDPSCLPGALHPAGFIPLLPPFPTATQPPLCLQPFRRQHPSVATLCLSEIKRSGLVYFGRFAVNTSWSTGGIWGAAITRFFRGKLCPALGRPFPSPTKGVRRRGRVDTDPSRSGTAGHKCNGAGPLGSSSVHLDYTSGYGERGSSLPRPSAEHFLQLQTGFHAKPGPKTFKNDLPESKKASWGTKNTKN